MLSVIFINDRMLHDGYAEVHKYINGTLMKNKTNENI